MPNSEIHPEVAELIKALKQSAPASPPAMTPQQVGGMIILKWVGGVFGTLVGAGLTAGMFWIISSLNDQGDKVDSIIQSQSSQELLDIEKEKMIDKEFNFIKSELKEVKANTKDRFTREDFLREVEPIQAQSNRAIEMLENRTSFIDNTNKRLTVLESKSE